MGANADLAQESFRRIESSDMAGFGELVTDDIEWRDPFGPHDGRDDVVEFMGSWVRAFPDLKFGADNIVEAGDTVVIEGTFSGTQSGPLAGPAGEIPPTGNKVAVPFCMVLGIRDGKCASFHGYSDSVAMLSQLGLMPQG